MNLRRARTIFAKEMLDTLRDKRTLIMMIGVPVVLYPAMLLIGLQAALVQRAALDEETSEVAIAPGAPARVAEWIREIPKVELKSTEAPERELAEGRLHAVISVPPDAEQTLAAGGSVPLDIRFDATEFSSVEASRRLQDGLASVRETLRDERLAAAGVSRDYIQPLAIERVNVAPPEKTAGHFLGLILPIIMVLMIALGAFYPAVDVTAGEKERGTFETLLATPVSKIEIVAGKFLTVVALALVTGLLNLASMALTTGFMVAQLKPALEGSVAIDIAFPFSAILVVLAAMLPLAVFISAVMMGVAVFARSFKEAQNYLTPFLLIILFPATYASFPGTKLTAMTQFFPVANVVLLFREAMTAAPAPDAVFAVLLSNTACAAAALLFAAWLFQREDVVLSEEHGIQLTLRRAEFRPRPALPAGMVLGFYAVMLVLIFFAGSAVQQWRIIPGIVITQWLLLLAPSVLLAWFVRVNLRQALSLRAPNWLVWPGAVLAAAGTTLLVVQAGQWHNKILPVPEALKEEFVSMLDSGNSPAGLVILLLAFALSPAICEEIFFRGIILSGLRQRVSPWAAILIVSVLFGLFHISIYRILPTALVGALLTYLTVRSASIFPSMLAHALNNAAAILLAAPLTSKTLTSAFGLAAVEEEGLPGAYLAGAGIALLAGIALIEAAARKHVPHAEP